MDPRTALLVASLMSLLNGGVLGLMHRSLIFEVRRSAVDWRIGTLLFAGAGMLMVAHEATLDPVPATPFGTLMAGALLPLAYLMVFVGACLYWRSIRRFCGESDLFWIFLPAVFGGGTIFVFTALSPSPELRGLVSSLLVALVLLASARTLQTSTRADVVISRRVFTVLLYAIGGTLLLRTAYFVALLVEPGIAGHLAWAYPATVLVMLVLPVIGTTCFLLMTSERGRQALQRAAHTDDLTALPNRRSILREAEARFASLRARSHGLAIAVIDVDFFKQINDRHGHAFGDAALRHVADVLAAHCASPHLLGRQGGEEFVALLSATGEDEALALCETLRRAVAATPYAGEGIDLSITASIGVSLAVDGDREYDDVLRRADAALYAAKARGRNRVEIGRP
ncbi:MAG: GGDEF domain-containing protein [Pseudomonadota bacterium]